jgi:hypothetical protein
MSDRFDSSDASGVFPVFSLEERDEIEERNRQLQSAAADCARATVTALDRLILAEAVCKAAQGWKRARGIPRDQVRLDAVMALEDAVLAWEKGQPS